MKREWKPGFGTRTDAYDQVVCWVYGLDVGERTTVVEISKALGADYDLATIRRAVAIMKTAKFVERITDPLSRAAIWERCPPTGALSLDQLVRQGVGPHVAHNILRALENGGYLVWTESGWRDVT